MRVDPEGSGIAAAPPALPSQLRSPLTALSVLGALVVVALSVLYAGNSIGTAFDISLYQAITTYDSPWRQIALVVDWTAEPLGGALVFLVLTVTCWKLGHRRTAVLAVAGPVLTVAVTTLLKPVVGRTINDGYLSFPSGHTASMSCVALIAMLVVVQRRDSSAGTGTLLVLVVTIPAAAAMAWAQVLLNAHYPTDTIGGYCTALAVVPATAWAIDGIAAYRAH